MKTVFAFISFLLSISPYLFGQGFEEISISLQGETISFVDVHDVDLDGDLDYFVSYCEDDPDCGLLWMENLGDFVFDQHPIEVFPNYPFPYSFHSADADADGDIDIDLFIHGTTQGPQSAKYLGLLKNNDGSFTNCLVDLTNPLYSSANNPEGTFFGPNYWGGALLFRENESSCGAELSNVGIGELFEENILSEDYDSDGDYDLVLINGLSSHFRFFKKNESGFEIDTIIEPDGWELNNFQNVTFQSDSSIDILVSLADKLVLYDNDGQGNFNLEVIMEGGQGYCTMEDFNNDGLKDIISSSSEIKYFKNLGEGEFAEPIILSENYSYSHSFGDMDGDGDLLSRPSPYSNSGD